MSHKETPLEKRLKKRLKGLGGRAEKERHQWARLYPVGLELDSTVAISRGAWKMLGAFADKWQSSAARDLKAMLTRQREWSLVWRDLQSVRGKLARSWRQPGSLPNWADVRDRMLSEAADHGVTREQILEHIGAFERASADDVSRAVELPVIRFARELEYGTVGRFSALAAAELAHAVSSFNIAVSRGSPKRLPRTVGRTSAKEAWILLRGLHGALRSGSARDVRARAREVALRSRKLLAPLVAAAAYDAILVRESSDINLARERHALDIALAIRENLFASSSSRAAAWIASWPEDSPLFTRWSSAAKATDFIVPEMHTSTTTPSDIVAHPGAFAGRRISVEGRVGAIEITHRGHKAISSTTLTDQAGAHIRVGLPYIKIDSGGMVPGAFARVTGYYSASHADFDVAVLVPDRRNLSDESRTDWLAWLALEIQPSYWSVPHNLNLEWTWAAGPEGPGNLLKYQVWSSGERRRIHVGES